jgi:hypothetical protein
VTVDQQAPDDPATRLLKRIVLVFVIGGFVVFQIPRSFDGLVSGDLGRQLAAAVGLAFWAWLSWRLVVLVRTRGAGRDPRYSYTSGIGYAAFFLIYSGLLAWRWIHGELDARVLPFMALVLGLAVVSLAAGRRLSRDASAASSASRS